MTALLVEHTVVSARIIGVSLDRRDKAVVTLHYDDDGRGWFAADAEIAQQAAQLLGRHVEARATFLRCGGRSVGGQLEGISERPRPQPGDLMAAVREVRAEPDAAGVVIDAEAWLAEALDAEPDDAIEARQ